MSDRVIRTYTRPGLFDWRNFVHVPTPAGGGGAYTAQGVRFDGTDSMSLTSALTGAADSKAGTLSFWLKMMGGDGTFQMLLEDGGIAGYFQILRQDDNTIRVQVDAPSTRLHLQTGGTFVAGGAWKHFHAYWDLATAISGLRVDGISDSVSPSTSDLAITWAIPTSWGFAHRHGGGLEINAELADFYLNTTTMVSDNTKFRTAGGDPVDLGSDGSTPTGSAPMIFFHGLSSTWHTNDGTGGGFTLTGTLTDASTNPP